MKYQAFLTRALLTLLTVAFAAGDWSISPVGGPDTPIVGTYENYTDIIDGTLLQGYLSVPPTLAIDEPPPMLLPAIIILHDAGGLDLYEQQRATIIAQQYGYAAFAADVFGYYAELPPEDAPWAVRGAFSGRYTNNSTLFAQRIQAAIDHVQSMEFVDASRVGMVGYCMGGTGVVHYLNVKGEASESKSESDVPASPPLLAGAVGVHPSLLGEGPGPVGTIDIPSLHLTGGADFLTGPASMEKLEEDMNAGRNVNVMAPWETVRYANIFHGFSNWFAGENYDERADARSWHSQMTFFEEIFDGDVTVEIPEADISPQEVAYVDSMDGDYPLIGHLSTPSGSEGTNLPVIVVLPDSSTSHELTFLAQMAEGIGSHTFVADTFSSLGDLGGLSETELKEMFHSDTSKYLSRIRAAINHVKTIPGADPTNVALFGSGFGGTGAMYYALETGVSDIAAEDNMKAIASFGGELDKVANATVGMVPESPPPGNSWGSVGGGSSGSSEWSSGSSESGNTDEPVWGTDNDMPDGPPSDFKDDFGSVLDELLEETPEIPAIQDGGPGRQLRVGARSNHNAHNHNNNKNKFQAHNSRTNRFAMVTPNQPQILIQSGVDADSMKDVIQIEQTLIAMGANYELSRFSDMEKVTVPGDAGATMRPFNQLTTILTEVFDQSGGGDETNETGTGPDNAAPMTTSPSKAPTVADPIDASATAGPTASPTAFSSAVSATTSAGIMLAALSVVLMI